MGVKGIGHLTDESRCMELSERTNRPCVRSFGHDGKHRADSEPIFSSEHITEINKYGHLSPIEW